MGIQSAIQWTDATWNPWQGCTKVSEACAHCYMFTDMKRYGKDPNIVRKSADPTFFLPMKRRRTGEYAIPPGHKVFTCSWSDWFHERADAWRPKAWSIIQQRPDVTFQIVTKRTERITECLPPDWGDGYPNVWLIATVENQHWADIRVRQLCEVPAVVRGLSMEPLLSAVDLSPWLQFQGPTWRYSSDSDSSGSPAINWVICGGESGHGARPMHPDWARALRDQCQAADVAFHFKQWGEWYPLDDDTELLHSDWFNSDKAVMSRIVKSGRIGNTATMPLTEPDYPGVVMGRVGKKAAGRTLDGRTWDEFPREVAANA